MVTAPAGHVIHQEESINTDMLSLLAVAASASEPLTSLDGAFFFEGFGDDWGSRWVVSKDSEFTGTWNHATYSEPEGLPGDKGIQVGNEARKHAVSTVFPEAYDPKDKGLVVQYELHTAKTIQCGGAYIKLLSATEELSADGFTNASPYTIMFGPDKCGATNKVHFILRHKSPKTGEWEEKHLASTPFPALGEKETHLCATWSRIDARRQLNPNQMNARAPSLTLWSALGWAGTLQSSAPTTPSRSSSITKITKRSTS